MSSNVTIQGPQTAADWAALNPVLPQFEIGVEKNPATGAWGRMKIGDGVTAWSGLSYIAAVFSKLVTFTENATNTVHTGTVPIPAGAWLINIEVTSSVLWTGGTAALDVGDTADADGYFAAVNLKATDLLVGEVLSIADGSNWGGKNGVYLVSATGRRGPAATNFGQYYAAGSNILGTVTVGTPATTAGRTFMNVTYSLGETIAAVATGP